ncbi:uncharacterized protein LOC141998647 isoform X2 [Natator depressus]|uniref:uncharacterized protein LOC141998647 isoform X2 n=1 Tax=Natator depressus TaxID=27790 RepID=UPI003EC04A47
MLVTQNREEMLCFRPCSCRLINLCFTGWLRVPSDCEVGVQDPLASPGAPPERSRCGKHTEGQRMLNAPRSDPGRWKPCELFALRTGCSPEGDCPRVLTGFMGSSSRASPGHSVTTGGRGGIYCTPWMALPAGSEMDGLELSPREQEDCERQREPEKELQKQQQHELAVGERRGIGDLPGDFIQDVVQDANHIWIGLKVTPPGGKWTWVDGSPLDPVRFSGSADGNSCGWIKGSQVLSETCAVELKWICQKEAAVI